MRNQLGQTTPLLNVGAAALRAPSLRSSLVSSLKLDSGKGYDVGPSETNPEDEARRRQQFETAGAAIDAALQQAAEQEAAAAAAAAAEEAKPFYLKKYGPLPVWGWGVGGVGLLLAGALLLRGRS